MATSPYVIANKAILDRQLREEAWQATSWAKWAKFASKKTGGKGWEIPTDSPIAIYRDFIEEGRDNMLVPLVRSLQDYPKLGSKTLKGNTEDPRFLWHKLFIQIARHGVKLPNKVNAQQIKWAIKARKYLPMLKEWWSRWENAEVTRAFLEGYSYNISSAVADGGLAKSKRYHKNTLVWDGTNKDFTTNAPTYAVGTGITSASMITAFQAGDSASDYFTTNTLEALAPEMSFLNIEPVVMKGAEPFYPIIINSRQAKSLRQDSEWLAGRGRGDERGSGNKIFNGAIGTWGKFVVYIDDVIARLPYYSGTTLNFFDYSFGTDYTTSGMFGKVQRPTAIATATQNIGCAIVLGANAMSKGIAVCDEDAFGNKTLQRESMGIGFAQEIDDFGMVKEIGSEQNYGYSRNDFFDEEVGTTPTAEYESRSAIVCTAVN